MLRLVTMIPLQRRLTYKMSDLNRGIMKFEGADKPAVVAISSIIVIGSIIALVLPIGSKGETQQTL